MKTNRRNFLSGLAAAAGTIGVATDALAGWWRRRRRQTCVAVCPPGLHGAPEEHCEWKDPTTLTFLVGGRLSARELQGVAQEERANLRWHIPGGSMYWPIHDHCWCGNYGAGTDGILKPNGTKETYFSWPDNADPSEDEMWYAAGLILERCEKLQAKYGELKNIRLMGHSAGCTVSNMATHRLAKAGYTIRQLILLSPPTYLPVSDTKPHPKFQTYYHEAFPNLDALPDFLTIRPSGDLVLKAFERQAVRTHFRFTEFRDYQDTNVQRVYASQIVDQTEFVLHSPFDNHWKPCDPDDWTQPIWDKVACPHPVP